jgi:hypothetical protein
MNGRNYLRDLGIDGRILKRTLKKQNVKVWTGWSAATYYEYSDAP